MSFLGRISLNSDVLFLSFWNLIPWNVVCVFLGRLLCDSEEEVNG